MIRYLTAGESHGPGLTLILDGCPAGLAIDFEQINYELSRRQKGYGRGGRMKIERDKVTPQSGIRHGKTLGSPISFLISNRDWENWQDVMHPVNPMPDGLTGQKGKLAYDNTRPRPGHADLSGAIKFHHQDLRNVLERASARETAAKVALGAIAKQFLAQFDIEFGSHVVRIGSVEMGACDLSLAEIRERSEESEVRCVDPDTEKKMVAVIKEAIVRKDSLGGVYEVLVDGLPVGLGGYSQSDVRLDGKLAAAVMSIPSVKGVEVGMGFETARRFGSEVHDQIYYDKDGAKHKGRFLRKTNNAGGLEGGMTNGERLVVRAANKPISTLYQPLDTVDIKTKKPAEAIVERTDNCVTPAHCVVAEAVIALTLFDVFLDKFGHDNLDDIKAAWQRHLDYSI
jgi:chorismate synthase